MKPDPIESGEASALASMFDAARAPTRPWRSDDFAAVLRHQLAAPLSVDLGTLRGVTAEHVKRLAGAPDPPMHTFADLLRHPAPPLDLLEMTKRFAKRARRKPQGAVPEEVAGVLYFGSIFAAHARCGVRISDLGDENLRDGVRWVLAQPWIDQATRAVFDQSVG